MTEKIEMYPFDEELEARIAAKNGSVHQKGLQRLLDRRRKSRRTLKKWKR
jgi:hypothetical protein